MKRRPPRSTRTDTRFPHTTLFRSGRVYNQTIDKSYPAPAGGTWVGPGQWAVIDLAQELGVPLRPQYNTGDTFVLVGDQVQRVPTTASPITNEAFIAKLDELAPTVSVDAPWAAPNAAKWDAMTYADYLDTSELSPEDREIGRASWRERGGQEV